MTAVERNYGARYFHPELGIMAVKAATDVVKAGPLRWGPDGDFWAYADGLWAPAEREVHGRIVHLLGERYRRHHAQNIRDVLRARVEDIRVDPTPAVINVPNGMLHWGAPNAPLLTEHGPEYLSTVQLPVRWDPEARCPSFETFLAESVAEDDRQRVWEVLGYLVMSGNPLQRMFLLTGVGGNGKGVLLHVITSLLGERNAAAVPLHAFTDDRFAPAELFGRLANICGDIPAKFIEDTAKIKELAGEDRISAERKYGQPFKFDFWGKSIFSANALPASADSSVGWLRRWEVINFPNAPTRPDRGLKGRLSTAAELEGILAKAVIALRMLMARGEFARGESATTVHREFARRSNKLLTWIDDAMIENPAAWYPRRELMIKFRTWDAFNHPGGRQMGTQTFYEKLRQTPGVRETKRQGIWGFAGLQDRQDIAFGEEIIIGAPETAPEMPPGLFEDGST